MLLEKLTKKKKIEKKLMWVQEICILLHPIKVKKSRKKHRKHKGKPEAQENGTSTDTHSVQIF